MTADSQHRIYKRKVINRTQKNKPGLSALVYLLRMFNYPVIKSIPDVETSAAVLLAFAHDPEPYMPLIYSAAFETDVLYLR